MANPKNGEPAVLPTPKQTAFLSQEQRDILAKSALCEKLDENQKAYFFEVVERTRLDPFVGQIRPDVRKKTEEDGTKTPTLIIITTLQGLRVIADRTGQLDGEDAPEWCGSDGQWMDVWLADDPPKAARASVHRKDRPRAQTQICRWDAFVQLKFGQGGNKIPNPFWQRMGSHMLGKCSLAGCYRGAFPNQCSGLYISEELSETLDPDSEEAIESEMIFRARREKAYWDEQATKGNYPIDVQQRMERERLQQPNGPLPSSVIGGPVLPTELLPKASAPPSAPPAPTTPRPAPPPTPVPPPPPEDWRNFVITRLTAFQGRTVGSLTGPEINGFEDWLKKVATSWGAIDADLKNHFLALRERLAFEKAHPEQEQTDQMDFSRL